MKSTAKKPATREELEAARWDALHELATRSLYHFVRQAWHVLEPEHPFADNWHIHAVCDHLEAVTRGQIKQLLINVPPGTMKSMLVCVFWPAWVWASSPAKRFMYSSYSETLSLRDSVKTRDLVTSDWYQERWQLALKDDQNAKGRFDNDRGGWRITGSITGKGIGEHPDFNVGDDPHNVLQAESDADRLNVKNWVEGVFLIRGEIRDVSRVMIMQRLHSLDASGVLLDKKGWVHLCFPMRYEAPRLRNPKEPAGPDNPLVPIMPATPIGFQDPRTVEGQLLWPAKFSDEKVTAMENNLGVYNAAGQLQQRPTPRGGAKFKRTWFDILGACPPLTDVVRYWDKAGTRGGSGARTAGVLMGKYLDATVLKAEFREKFIVLDVTMCREQAAEREKLIKQQADLDLARWGAVSTWVEQEPGSGGKESAEGTVGNLVGFACYIERVTGSKEVRAEPLMSQASVGKVKLLQGTWNQGFLDELEHFPNGKLKDQVDGASGAFNKLWTGTGAFSSSSELQAPSLGGPVDEVAFHSGENVDFFS